MRFQIDGFQVIDIFKQTFEILEIKNQFDLWLKAMIQYQDTLILNPDLPNQNTKFEEFVDQIYHTYKNAIMQNDLELFGPD